MPRCDCGSTTFAPPGQCVACTSDGHAARCRTRAKLLEQLSDRIAGAETQTLRDALKAGAASLQSEARNHVYVAGVVRTGTMKREPIRKDTQ